jgi:hypothetical protein
MNCIYLVDSKFMMQQFKTVKHSDAEIQFGGCFNSNSFTLNLMRSDLKLRNHF